MSTKTIRPGLTAATRVSRELLAAGWHYDSTTDMADNTTERVMLHPSGREITARTANGGEPTDLTLTNLTLEQVAGAITGAGLTGESQRPVCAAAAAGVHCSPACYRSRGKDCETPLAGKPEPEHAHIGGSFGGPGENEVECACGLVFGGFDSQASALAMLERHIANPEPASTPTAEPDYWLTLAADLRQAADRVATLAGTPVTDSTSAGPAPRFVVRFGLGSITDHTQTVPLVDVFAAAFGVTPATRQVASTYQYDAQHRIGALTVEAYTRVPNPEQSELERLRARVAELEAERTQDGTR